MTDPTHIEFDALKRRFLITSPPWDVARARGIPNRRWIKGLRAWSAPALRLNAEYLLLKYKDSTWTPEARAAADAALVVRAQLDFHDEPRWIRKTEPKKHQSLAGSVIYALKAAALLMGCRTGKSKVIIDDFNAHFTAGHVDAMVLVCPYSINRNWPKELGKHSAIEPRVFLLQAMSTKAEERKFDEFVASREEGRPDWLIVGIEALSQGRGRERVERFLLARRACMTIDESSRIKTHNSARTEECVRLGRMATMRRIGTGSSVTKGIQDLYAQYQFLDENIIGIGDFWSFRNRYCVMGGYENKQIIGYDNVDELMGFLKPYTVMMDTRDVLDLPPKEPERRYVQMTAEQKKLYRDIKNALPMVGDKTIKVQNALERALRWQQVIDGFYSWSEPDPLNPKKPRVLTADVPGGCPKLNELMAIADEHGDCSIIVWTPYAHSIRRIAAALRKEYGNDQVVELHGGIDDVTRWDNIAKFEAKRARFFVGNAATGGMGFDLKAGDIEVYYSNTGNYEDRYQSEWRTMHMDKTSIVKTIDLVGEGSIDEDTLDAFEAKQSLGDYVKERLRRGEAPFKHIDG